MIGNDILKSCRVGVLAGGASSEREISLKSGRAVHSALTGLEIDSVFIDVDESALVEEIRRQGVNVAFIALHGKFGEDGTVQQLLSSAGVPYTGSDPTASRSAIDKLVSKQKFREAGLLVPNGRSVVLGVDLEAVVDAISLPCVVKPRYEGSSIGLSVVAEKGKIAKAIQIGLKFGNEVIVEDFIPGREITVGVLEGKALPVIEITAVGGVYDYGSKYVSSGTVYNVPAKIGDENSIKAQGLGLAAHNALGCSGFSRTDMRMTPEGDFYVLEVNTIPGLTEKSLLPMAAKVDGVDFGQLCVKMLESAFSEKFLKQIGEIS